MVQIFLGLSYLLCSIVSLTFLHWISYSSSGNIGRYTPNNLLLCCDEIKNWSINEYTSHFFYDCLPFEENFKLQYSYFETKLLVENPSTGYVMLLGDLATVT